MMCLKSNSMEFEYNPKVTLLLPVPNMELLP